MITNRQIETSPGRWLRKIVAHHIYPGAQMNIVRVGEDKYVVVDLDSLDRTNLHNIVVTEEGVMRDISKFILNKI
jgi:hypothetical protein